MPYKDIEKRKEAERKRRADPVCRARDLAARKRYKKSEKGRAAEKRYRDAEYSSNKDKHRERKRLYREMNRDLLNKRILEWSHSNPAKRREIQKRSALKCRYGLTEQQIDSIGKDQGWVCKICSMSLLELDSIGRKKLSVDHCHKTGKVRGLLCTQCNRGIGHFQDNPDLLERAVSYLRESINVVGA